MLDERGRVRGLMERVGLGANEALPAHRASWLAASPRSLRALRDFDEAYPIAFDYDFLLRVGRNIKAALWPSR